MPAEITVPYQVPRVVNVPVQVPEQVPVQKEITTQITVPNELPVEIPTKRLLEPPIPLTAAQKAMRIRQQQELLAGGMAYGVYHPEFSITGETGPLETGALLGVGSRPQFVTPQDVQTLNSQGILVKPENMAQPSTSAQTLNTQGGTITVDPVSEAVLQGYAQQQGTTTGALTAELPARLRTLVEGIQDPATQQAVLDSFLSAQLSEPGASQQAQSPEAAASLLPQSQRLGVPSIDQLQAEAAPVSYPLTIAQAQGLAGGGGTMNPAPPDSPMLSQSSLPYVQDTYSLLQQLYMNNAISLQQYYAGIQSLYSIVLNGGNPQQALNPQQAEEEYVPAQQARKRALAEG